MLSVGLVFIQFFGSRVPPTTSIQKIGFPSQVSRNGGPREDRISRDSQSAFEKRSLKRPSITEAPPCLNFEGSPPVEGGTDVVPRDILSSATLTNALHEGIPGQARARRPPPPQSFVQFFGSRVPPTTSIQRIGFRLPVEAECRGSADTHNPDSRSSPPFGTTVHDQWNCCSRRTLRLRVAFDPQFLYPTESGAQVIPVVRLDVLLVQFGKHGLEVTKAADRAVILVVAPGRVLANTSQQDNLLDALQQNPTLEPASCQDFVGGRERRLYAGPSLEQFLDRGDEGVRGVVEHLLFTLLVRPVSLSHFHHTPAEATMAEPASTNAGGFHLA